jgi:hypothetical protein
VLPTTPARVARDYVRHGTTSLFAALDIPGGSPRRTGNPLCRQRKQASFEIIASGDMPGRCQVTIDSHLQSNTHAKNSGAKEIRTPDLLHAIWRQHVHPRPSPQVTVLPRPCATTSVRMRCGTFLLYRTRPADTALLAQPLLPRGGMELIPARNGRVSRSRIWIGHRHHTQGSHASCS